MVYNFIAADTSKVQSSLEKSQFQTEGTCCFGGLGWEVFVQLGLRLGKGFCLAQKLDW